MTNDSLYLHTECKLQELHLYNNCSLVLTSASDSLFIFIFLTLLLLIVYNMSKFIYFGNFIPVV